LFRLLGDKQERNDICKQQILPGNFDVIVSSNESVLKEACTIKKFKWRYVIIDEAHRIKNEHSSLSKLVRLLVTDFKILITGTPLQNNLHELWALLNFLLPDVFDNSALFDSWFNTADTQATSNVIQRLHSVLRPFMLRRVKADVEKELPPKKETKLYVGMTDLQRKWYTQVRSVFVCMCIYIYMCVNDMPALCV
jgi:SWI/SNF-related matrix-associated actin-dependent regulator of chromatin subfamily A member 5